MFRNISHVRFSLGQVTTIFCVLFFGSSFSVALAVTAGNAWSENLGWINFGTTGGNIQVTSSGLAGSAWSANYGWINLNPTKSGVKNDGNGNLSGYAWGEQTGYINFAGVIINSSGVFTGHANGTVAGDINFNCTHCNVTTDWRPVTNVSESGGGSSGGSGSGGGGGGGSYTAPESPVAVPSSSISTSSASASASSSILSALISELNRLLSFLNPAPTGSPAPTIEIPKIAPPALKGQWTLLAPPALGNFVLAPLPKNLSLFVQKFPTLKQTFEALGVARASALPKLQGVTFSLPSLGESAGLPQTEITTGKLVLPEGIPVVALTPRIKEGIPSEVVFARSQSEKVDLNETVTIDAQGNAQTQVHAGAGQTVKFIIKPIAPVNSVRGYLVLRSRGQAGIGDNKEVMNLQTALASLIFKNPLIAQNVTKNAANIDEKLALTAFNYKDEGDGIYTADVVMPNIDGEYDIVTLISYKDPELGTREIGLTTVVDPEGYVYEANGGKQTRIPNATVSLFWENPVTGIYVSWPAAEYSQVNPQVTSVAGTYAFLVPQGKYYLTVSAPGYHPYVGAPFDAIAGSNIHENVELSPNAFWATWDWKTVLIIIVAFLLLANFYREQRSTKK